MTRRSTSTSPRKSRSGGAAIEFGLIFPVLIAILGSVVEYGLMFNEYLSVVSATRDGARWGANWTVDSGDSEAEAITRVRDSLDLVTTMAIPFPLSLAVPRMWNHLRFISTMKT